MINSKDLLEQILSRSLKTNANIEKELRKLPAGRLVISHDGDRYYFSRDLNGRRKGITRDKDMVHKLARRRYLECVQREMKEEVAFAKKYLKPNRQLSQRAYGTISKLFDVFKRARLNIPKITYTAEQYAWASENFERNTMNPDQLRFETNGGVKVRSKSELLIGNALEELGIPYRYEQAVRLNIQWLGVGTSKYKTYYPDFTILLPNGKFIIWEHLGMMHLESYRIHNAEKIAALRGKGHVKFENFIATFEGDLVSSDAAKAIIASKIVPRML